MASVHKPKSRNSPYFVAAWRDSTGKLHVRSTKQTDKTKALAFALECERAEKKATAGTLTEAQARTILADILERTHGGETLRNPSARDWLTDWLAGKETNRAETTGIRYRQTVEKFLAYLGDRESKPLSSILPRDIEGFLEMRAKQGAGPSTRNVDGKTLRSAFNRARKQGIITVNPAEAVELPARQSIERGTFTPSEIGLLVDAAGKEWKTLILIAYYTGARLSECCRVSWPDVSFTEGTITFPKTKTGKKQVTPLHPGLQKHLEGIAGDATGPIMPHLASVRVSGRRGLSRHFLDLMHKAGIATETDKGAGSRALNLRSFHAIRHSFNSALANAGVAKEIRMKLIGHKSEVVNDGYTHHQLQTLRDGLEKIADITTIKPEAAR